MQKTKFGRATERSHTHDESRSTEDDSRGDRGSRKDQIWLLSPFSCSKSAIVHCSAKEGGQSPFAAVRSCNVWIILPHTHRPPSTGKLVSVMKDDAGSAKKRAALAMSEGSDRRPSGTDELNLVVNSQ